jgi:hypothetical protein
MWRRCSSNSLQKLEVTERMKFFLLVFLFTFSRSERCRESESIALIENETKRDVSFIRQKDDGSCTIKFVDSSR